MRRQFVLGSDCTRILLCNISSGAIYVKSQTWHVSKGWMTREKAFISIQRNFYIKTDISQFHCPPARMLQFMFVFLRFSKSAYEALSSFFINPHTACYTDLSTAMAAIVLTEAQTDTPCRYGVALHMNQPKCHSETQIYCLQFHIKFKLILKGNIVNNCSFVKSWVSGFIVPLTTW